MFYAKCIFVTVILLKLDFEAIWKMNYEASGLEISKKCLGIMTSHLWYLHSSNIPFSLQDNGVSAEEKREIADTLIGLSKCDMVASEYDKPKMYILN